jgi:hypothetical protein
MNVKRELREQEGSLQPQSVLTGALEFPGGTAIPLTTPQYEVLIGGSTMEILGAELVISEHLP